MYRLASDGEDGVPVAAREAIQSPATLPLLPNARAIKIGLTFLLILGYFLLLGFDGLRAYFTSDDGMNLIKMHGCFTEPLWHIVLQALAVCTPAYRPLGGLFYRVLYAFFHFDPLPFRVACYCILVLNIGLAGWLLRCLSGLWEIAAVGTLLFSYHAMLIELFYNTGTIYDLLCATFYMLALLCYIYTRSREPELHALSMVSVFILYCCALDSKEMAASLPLVLLAYELVYYGIPAKWARPVWRRFRAIVLLVALTAVFTAVKTLSSNPMSQNVLYQPQLSHHSLLNNLSWYYNLLVYRRHFFTSHTVILCVVLMFASCWLPRSRMMLFGLLFALITLLPVLIIPPRDGLVLYLPLLGWALWITVPLVKARIAITKFLFHGNTQSRAHTATQAALLLLLIVLLYPLHQRKRNDLRFTMRLEQSEMRSLLEQLKIQHPTFPRNIQMAFVEDPFPRGDWGLFFLVPLEYANPTIAAFQKKDLPNFKELEQGFQYLFAYKDGELHQIPRNGGA